MAGFEPRMTGDFEPQVYRLAAWVVLVGAIAGGVVALASGRDVVTSLSVVVVGLIGFGVLRIMLAVEANTHRSNEVLIKMTRHLERIESELGQATENILLSEQAKSIAFRKKDTEALQQAIEEELTRHDWQAAMYLADQMETRFGYRQQAQQVRERIRNAQTQHHQQELAVVLAGIQDLLAAYDWDRAAERIALLQEQFPDDPEVMQLTETLEQVKTQRKKELLLQWDQAVQQDQVDRGIDILRELDAYLTANEVAALEESARGVFRAKLHNLGMQFSMLVTEKMWDKALEVAREVVEEFPNSRMAQEIRDRMSALEAKAASQHSTE